MPLELGSICVFCGSSPGADPVFADTANELGKELTRRNIRLVYGGGNVGLMGVLADSVIEAGGQVLGVITRALLDKELAHGDLTDLLVFETMHERKAAMADSSDGFIMLPGGFGTLDEFFEALTWTQLGIHSKPCGVLDPSGYFDPLRQLFDTASKQRFLRPEHVELVKFETDASRLLDGFASWTAPSIDKWLDRKQR